MIDLKPVLYVSHIPVQKDSLIVYSVSAKTSVMRSMGGRVVETPLYSAEQIADLQEQVRLLREALKQSQYAMREPLDAWKGDKERLALDLCNTALAATAPKELT